MRKLLLIAIFLSKYASFAQTVYIDQTFNASGVGPDGMVYDFLTLPDGKIVIAGLFSSYNGIPRKSIARLNADGSLDTEFNPGSGAYGAIRCLALAPDGKILIGGTFSSYNGVNREYVARINSNGSLDGTFNASGISQTQGLSVSVQKIVILPDEKILVGGSLFMSGAGGRNLYRLNSNGTKDLTFTPTSTNFVFSLLNFENGEILAGFFGAFPGQQIRKINTSGGFNNSFTAFDTKGTTNNLHYQPDGKVLVVGNMAAYEGEILRRWPVSRMNADGSQDETFQRYFIDPENNSGEGVTMVPFGNRYLLGGNFNGIENNSSRCILAINPDGTEDETLSFGLGFDQRVTKIVVLPGNQLLISGWFWNYNGVPLKYFGRFKTNALSTLQFSEINRVVVHTQNGTINYGASSAIRSIKVYDISGRLIHESDNISANEYSANLNANNQMLLSRVLLENGAIVTNKTAL